MLLQRRAVAVVVRGDLCNRRLRSRAPDKAGEDRIGFPYEPSGQESARLLVPGRCPVSRLPSYVVRLLFLSLALAWVLYWERTTEVQADDSVILGEDEVEIESANGEEKRPLVGFRIRIAVRSGHPRNGDRPQRALEGRTHRQPGPRRVFDQAKRGAAYLPGRSEAVASRALPLSGCRTSC